MRSHSAVAAPLLRLCLPSDNPHAFKLDFPIPEVVAEVGDRIQFHPRKGLILSRQLSPAAVTLLRAHFLRVLGLLDREDS